MRINPKLAHRLGGTDCIFYHTRNSWRIYPQKIERKQDERKRDGWVPFWVTAWSLWLTIFWFVFSRMYKRILWIMCVPWRRPSPGTSERAYGVIQRDRRQAALWISNPTLCCCSENVGLISKCKKQNNTQKKHVWKEIMPEQILVHDSNPQTSTERTWTIRGEQEKRAQCHPVNNTDANKLNSRQIKCTLRGKYQIILIAKLLYRNC